MITLPTPSTISGANSSIQSSIILQPKKRSTTAGDTQPDLNLPAHDKITSNATRDLVSCITYNKSVSAITDNYLDALPKWRNHTQTNTRPTDEDNSNAYHGEDDTDKLLPPPPLPAKLDHTQVVDHVNIAARDDVDTDGRQKSPNMSTTSHDREGSFAVNPPPSHHTGKTQAPPISQTLSKINGKHGVLNKLTLKNPYSKSITNTAEGGVREKIQPGNIDNITRTSKCYPPMALVPIPNEDLRSVIDSIHLHRPKRGTPDPGTETDGSHTQCQKTTIIKPDPTLSRRGPATNEDARLIPDRGKNPHENQDPIIRNHQWILDIF